MLEEITKSLNVLSDEHGVPIDTLKAEYKGIYESHLRNYQVKLGHPLVDLLKQRKNELYFHITKRLNVLSLSELKEKYRNK